MAIEQPELKDVLELLQVLGEGGLADAQRHGRLEEAVVRLNGVDGPQQREPEALIEVAARHLRDYLLGVAVKEYGLGLPIRRL
jgi:hypothetical protein